jgi:hypothetical protein
MGSIATVYRLGVECQVVTTLLEQLRDALTAFMAASATRDSGKIGAALNRVLELEAQLPADAPERFRHFLSRRSYQKALEFLDGKL